MKLHYSRSGAGPDVVVLHGLFGSGDNWAGIARALSDEFRIACVDLRNHGRSPHAAEMSYELMAGDLLEFVQDHIGGLAHVVGHSLGGKVAMAFSNRYPAQVRSLTVVDIAPRGYALMHDGIMDALLGLRLEVGASRQDLEGVLAGKIPDLPTRRFLLKNLERLPEGGWRWRLNLDAIRANYHALSGPLPLALSFSGPALFLKGQHSDYILPEDEPRIRSFFPAARLFEVPGAGHWVHYDAPYNFTGVLRRFLRQSESAGLRC